MILTNIEDKVATKLRWILFHSTPYTNSQHGGNMPIVYNHNRSHHKIESEIIVFHFLFISKILKMSHVFYLQYKESLYI